MSLVPVLSFGQTVKVQTIRQINPLSKEVYIFPKVAVSNSLLATQRINHRLREYVLGIDGETEDSNIFDSIWRTSYRMENVSNLSFSMTEINSSIVSLSISGEGCGAYCEPFEYHFTFSAKTGHQLTLNSLFTNKGLLSFVKILNDNKMKKLRAKLKQINQSVASANAKRDASDKERLSEMNSMYTDCLSKRIEINAVSDIQFLVKNGTLTVYTDRCSAHYNMVYDEVWKFVYRADLKNLKSLLSEYGKSLIND